jgi:D-alanyl-D-alanine carboxypeptidase-like protein
MLRSQNAWSANDRSCIASYSLPGGEVALRKGDPSVVLLWCANRWHETVEPLRWPGVWGYAERAIRGSSTTLSNHASGTAIDINAPQHPLGTDPRDNFSTLEIRAIRAILDFCEGTVRWGGDYTGRKDGMHLEIVAGAVALKRIADKIRNHQSRPPVVAQAKAPAPPLPAPREDAMLIKSQPDKTQPHYVAALLTGFNFVGLGRTETPTDEQAARMGLPVLWVEYSTYQEFDRRSHAVLDRAQPTSPPNPPSPALRPGES